MSIENLKKQEKEAIKKLSAIRKEMRSHWLAYYRQKYGVYAGAIIFLSDGRKAAVTEVLVGTSPSYGKPWIKGRIEKKDGSFGRVANNLFDDWTGLDSDKDSNQ